MIRFFKSRGFTMVETLVALGILGLFFAAIAQILQMIIQNTGESRVRTTALAIAQSKMEVIKNLPYINVGTNEGIPAGPIPQTEIVTINTLPFTVTTSLIYIDDPYDGITPQDTVNTDYKRVRVEITWKGAYPSRKPISLVTNIVPKGIESANGGGTLFITAFDALGQTVPNAIVKIDNTSISPPIHIQTLTNNDGLVILPGTPPCNNCYEISVTKDGYSVDKTYASCQITNPVHPHASIIEGQPTKISFAIDKVATITLRSYGTKESGYPPISNVRFTIKGTKIIGYDTDDNPILKYSYTTNTGGGIVSIGNLEWDSYYLDLTDSFYNLTGSSPVAPIALSPATNMDIAISVTPKTNTSLLVIIKNNSGELQASASANLTNLSYDQTKYTAATGSADYGQVYFGGLSPATYDLKVNLSGYQESTASVNIITNQQETVILNPVI